MSEAVGTLMSTKLQVLSKDAQGLQEAAKPRVTALFSRNVVS